MLIRHRQMFGDQHRFAPIGAHMLRRVIRVNEGRSELRRHELLCRDVSRRPGVYYTSTAQHRDIVRNGACLLQLVRDDHCGVPCVDIRSKPAKEIVHFGRSKYGRRLVENEKLGITSERLGNLHTLLCTNR